MKEKFLRLKRVEPRDDRPTKLAVIVVAVEATGNSGELGRYQGTGKWSVDMRTEPGGEVVKGVCLQITTDSKGVEQVHISGVPGYDRNLTDGELQIYHFHFPAE